MSSPAEMEQAVRRYWAALFVSGQEAASCFHSSGYFLLPSQQLKIDNADLTEFLSGSAGSGGSVDDIRVIAWTFDVAARSCAVEIEMTTPSQEGAENAGTFMCDVFKFAPDSALFTSLHVYATA